MKPFLAIVCLIVAGCGKTKPPSVKSTTGFQLSSISLEGYAAPPSCILVEDGTLMLQGGMTQQQCLKELFKDYQRLQFGGGQR